MHIIQTFSAYELLSGVESEPFERAVEKPARCSPPLPGISFSGFGACQVTGVAMEQKSDVVDGHNFDDGSERDWGEKDEVTLGGSERLESEKGSTRDKSIEVRAV
jgi:hypothetical protein